MPPATPAIQEFESELGAILTGAEDLVHRLTRLAAVRAANARTIETAIAGTLDGGLVPGTQLTRARALAVSRMFDSFIVWLTAPITIEPEAEPAGEDPGHPAVTARPIDIILERPT